MIKDPELILPLCQYPKEMIQNLQKYPFNHLLSLRKLVSFVNEHKRLPR